MVSGKPGFLVMLVKCWTRSSPLELLWTRISCLFSRPGPSALRFPCCRAIRHRRKENQKTLTWIYDNICWSWDWFLFFLDVSGTCVMHLPHLRRGSRSSTLRCKPRKKLLPPRSSSSLRQRCFKTKIWSAKWIVCRLQSSPSCMRSLWSNVKLKLILARGLLQAIRSQVYQKRVWQKGLACSTVPGLFPASDFGCKARAHHGRGCQDEKPSCGLDCASSF